jgi:lipoate-protein ligase A
MLQAYDLADARLIEYCRQQASSVDDITSPRHMALQYVPLRTMVVLGASNSVENSVYRESCSRDAIPIIQRPSGGEAVLISPQTLLFSHCMLAKALPRSADFFHQNLRLFTLTLEELGVQDLRYNGISDLCIGERKILGCAIYRRPGMVLFQAVLNVDLDPSLIVKYLRQPARMPDYRKNRSHDQFVTSLRAEGYAIAIQEIDLPRIMGKQGIHLSPVPG